MADINRREFLQRTTQSGLGAAALTLLGTSDRAAAQASQAQAQSQAQQQAAGMFLSLPPWAVARNTGWPEQARIAARAGYAGIDWAFGPARAAGVEATRALLAELKIRATIVNLPMKEPLDAEEGAFKAQLPKLAEDAAFCQAIGCRNFQFVLRPTTGGAPKEERWKIVRDRFAAIGEVIANHDMRLGLEFLGPLVFRTRPTSGSGTPGSTTPPVPPVPFVWTLPETLKLCADSAPNIGVTLDAWHWYHSGGTVADITAAPAARIVHVHVSDARTMPPEEVLDNMRLLCGEGVIDLIGFFKALRQIGYTGGVAPEAIGPRIPDDMPPEESARLAWEKTAAVMKKAGVMA
jgi:sugar phosphate isomerase/epimerase